MASINETLTRIDEAEDPLTGLSYLEEMRRETDLVERRLIEDARAQGTGWAQIAAALGLKSRQAAEQRWLRLCGEKTRDPIGVRTSRRYQQSVDTHAGPAIRELRAAVVVALREIDDDPAWDGIHSRAVLLRESLSAAVSAAPGALYALVRHAVEDLGVLDHTSESLDRLRDALDAATPRT